MQSFLDSILDVIGWVVVSRLHEQRSEEKRIGRTRQGSGSKGTEQGRGRGVGCEEYTMGARSKDVVLRESNGLFIILS